MQAVTNLIKLVGYTGASLILSSVFSTVVKSVVLWDALASLPELIGLNVFVAQAFVACLAAIGFLALYEDMFEVQSLLRILIWPIRCCCMPSERSTCTLQHQVIVQ